MHILFFSYSHQDEALRDQLEVHLSMLRRQGLIEAWHDRRITAGEDFHGEISAHLEEADVILLLRFGQIPTKRSSTLRTRYRDGKAVARCGVRLGGAGHFSGNIAYSTGDAPETNSYNESLSVDADDQTLFFKSLGLSDFGRNGEREKLSTQGAAELLWGLFIAPLQQT